MSIFKTLAFLRDYRAPIRTGPLIFYRYGRAYLRSPPSSSSSSSSSLCHAPKNLSNQHIFAYPRDGESDGPRATVSKGASLIYFLALPPSACLPACLPTHGAQRTSAHRNWNEIRNTLNNVRGQDLLLHVGKPVRESDIRFVPPRQEYSSFREFIPQFTTRARSRCFLSLFLLPSSLFFFAFLGG